MRNKIIGRFGEQLACDYLRRQGYNIIKRNYQASYKEIDIVAQKRNILVFVEVKTRTTTTYGDGIEAVDYFKQRSLKKGIGYFLGHESIEHKDVRADLITIYIDRKSKRAKIKHYENIL